MAFEVESADLHFERLRGELTLRGTSGDVEASDIGGSWSSEFTSGDLKVRGFRGERLKIIDPGIVPDILLLAKALTNLDFMGAKAIGIDILFDQPQDEAARGQVR